VDAVLCVGEILVDAKNLRFALAEKAGGAGEREIDGDNEGTGAGRGNARRRDG